MIISPQQLWKDYKGHENPAMPSLIKTASMDGGEIQYLYFNGQKADDGIVRVFAKFYIPKKSKEKGAVLILNDVDADIEAFDPTPYLKLGLAVLAVDYSGEKEDKARYTLYPKSLNNGNFWLHPEKLNDFDMPIQKSCWYFWSLVALYGMAFLEQEGYKNRFALGVGHGGDSIWTVCYLKDVAIAGATQYSGGPVFPKEESATPAQLAFKAAWDQGAYAAFLSAPVFMQITSNEQDSSLHIMNDLYKHALDNPNSAGAYLSIAEKRHRTMDASRADNPAKWFNYLLQGAKPPKSPKIASKGLQGKLYFEITVDRHEKIEEVSFFAAHAQENSAFRNWRSYEVSKTSDTEYSVHVPVYSALEPVFAFANIRYSNGIILSTSVERAIPNALSVLPTETSGKRLMYDASMGISDWMLLCDGERKEDSNLKKKCPLTVSGVIAPCRVAKLTMKKCSMEIEGITSLCHRLTTLRLADSQFVGPRGASLQLSIYTKKPQKIAFNIQSSKDMQRYTSTQTLDKSDSWHKVMLQSSNFRSQSGTLSDWDSVLTFEIESEEMILLNSMRWV